MSEFTPKALDQARSSTIQHPHEPWMNASGIIDRAPSAEELRRDKIGLHLAGIVVAQSTLVENSLTDTTPSLLGVREDSDKYLAQKSDEVFGYGNAEERLKKFKTMDFSSFKSILLKLNNAVRKKGVDDAPQVSGFTSEGRFAVSRGKLPHIYPDAEDTTELLEYAFNRAKAVEDPQDAALILSGGFVATHPFNDGNGRVSRQLYAELSAGITPGNSTFDSITASTTLSRADKGGAGIVNIGSFANNDPIIKAQLVKDIYRQTDVTKYNALFSGLNYTQDKETGMYCNPPEEALKGLTKKQALWLEDVYANVRDLTIDRTDIVSDRGKDESFRFALSYAIEKFPGFVTAFEKKEIGEPRNRYLDIEELFQSGNTDFMSAMADGAREYYKQYAKSLIDMLGGSDLAKKQIEHPGGGTISIRDRIVEVSTNFLAESLENKPDSQSTNRTLEMRLVGKEVPRLQIDNNNQASSRDEAPLGSRKNPVIINSGFRGDPRRVIGHPSNPMTNASSAYADELRRQRFNDDE